MTGQTLSTGDKQAIAALIDAYGAELSRWPEAARDQYGALAGMPDFDALKEDAAVLDAILQGAVAPAAPAYLNERLLASFDVGATAPKRGVVAALKNIFATDFMLPAGGFAALAAVGFVTGFFYSAPLSPEEQAYAYFAGNDEFYFDDFQEAAQ